MHTIEIKAKPSETLWSVIDGKVKRGVVERVDVTYTVEPKVCYRINFNNYICVLDDDRVETTKDKLIASLLAQEG